MHPLLERQLRRVFGEAPPADPRWPRWLELVDRCYLENDDDRRLLERSLELVSQELLEKNRRLREENARLQAIERDLRTQVVEREAAEGQLRQAQKMDAVGRLAGGVAHDFNNLLVAILGYTDLAIRRLPADDPLTRDLVEVHKAGVRAASLTHQLLAMSRKQVLRPRLFDVNALLDDVTGMLRRVIGEHVAMTVHKEGALHAVLADPSQLTQVVLNLVVNARDAMPEGGRLVLATANVEVDAARVAAVDGGRPGSYVALEVTDTGVGMDAATQARLFEPFFTTKEAGKGTGLGLSTVYGIIRQSGGLIEVESALGRGTTFRILLPRAEAGEAAAGAAARSAARAAAGERILLVEDEPAPRALCTRVLREAGYPVVPVASAGEALRAWRRGARPFDLVVTDVVMPGGSGPDLARRLIAYRGPVRVLLMSGYTADALGPQGALEPGVALIEKPFTPETFLLRIREALDGPLPEAAPCTTPPVDADEADD